MFLKKAHERERLKKEVKVEKRKAFQQAQTLKNNNSKHSKEKDTTSSYFICIRNFDKPKASTTTTLVPRETSN